MMPAPVKRRRALLGSNPSRNSRLETHSDVSREPVSVDRFPELGGDPRAGWQIIGVDLHIPQKPMAATTR
jgi:hypothetical protein